MRASRLVILAVLSAAVSLLAGQARAVVAVVGEGPGRACYIAAKTGTDPAHGLQECNQAMDVGLTLHDRAATFVNRGVIEHKLGRVDQAIDDFNACLRIMPDQGDAYLNRGVGYLVLKRNAEALDDIEKGIALGPSEPAVAYYDRGIAEEQLGRLLDAYHDYQRAVALMPGFTAASDALSRFTVTTKPRAS